MRVRAELERKSPIIYCYPIDILISMLVKWNNQINCFELVISFPLNFVFHISLPKTHSLPSLFQSVNDTNIFPGAVTECPGNSTKMLHTETWIFLLPWMYQIFKYSWSNFLGRSETSWVTRIHQLGTLYIKPYWTGRKGWDILTINPIPIIMSYNQEL